MRAHPVGYSMHTTIATNYYVCTVHGSRVYQWGVLMRIVRSRPIEDDATA